MSETPVLLRERHGNVEVLCLNRPEKRNALNRELIETLGEAVTEIENDPSIRAIVLTGSGDRAFCAGMDLSEFAAKGGLEYGPGLEGFKRLTRGEIKVPVVGAVNATAFAGGFELLLSSDVIVASEAALFGLPEVKRGLFAAGGGMYLGLRVPYSIALELALTGDPITAARAYVGLVNAVVAPDQVLPKALEYAERIAANGPLGLAATKELVRLAVRDVEAAETRHAEWQSIVFASDDAKEGARAFVEKRDPVWTGR